MAAPPSVWPYVVRSIPFANLFRLTDSVSASVNFTQLLNPVAQS